MTHARTLLLAAILVSCAKDPPRPPAAPATPAAPEKLELQALPLPGATAPVSLDYLAFEPGRARVWVPVAGHGAGSVDVYDTKSGTFARVDGFKTAERERNGRTRTVGPSAVAIGEGAAYVGNRATSEVCPVDLATLKVAACIALGAPPDGVAYVAPTREVWVTTPGDHSIAVLDASEPLALKARTVIHLEGAPEGYSIDAGRGLFFTNLEDKNQTVVIDLAKHTPVATWNLDCGSDGPRGVASDARGLVYVACTDRVLVLDGLHGGAKLAIVDTGAGVDNIDVLEPRHLLFAAAGKAARLTVAQVGDHGEVTPFALGATVEGARNGVVDDSGKAYVADPMNARLLVFAGRAR